MASGDETARNSFISRADADAAIALRSPACVNSEYTAAGWQAAFAADPFNEKNRLIVLRGAGCRAGSGRRKDAPGPASP